MTTSSSAVGGPAGTAPGELSVRELEIIAHICRGDSNLEIAAELYLSINTVKTHIRSAYRRIGTTRRVEAVLWGAQHGLVSAEDSDRDSDPGSSSVGPSEG